MNFRSAWLTTNKTCNNRCKWCYAIDSLNSNSIMNFEKAKLMVNELKKHNVNRIVLIGGEPTIYPEFINLVKYIHDNNIKVSVATNGRKFHSLEFSKSVLDAGIDNIDFSLKGLSEEEYLANTGTTGFNEMLVGYKNLVNIGFLPSVSYVIIDDDHLKFDNLINFVKEYEIKRFSLQFVKPVLRLGNVEPIFDLKDMGKFVTYIYNKLSQTNINYSIEISFPLCLIDRNILDKLITENKIINCCHVPQGSGINIDENFKIIPCNHFADFPFSETAIDFTSNSFIDSLYESDIVKSFRKLARSYPSLKCQECNLWELCGGGCFTRWLSLNPDDYIKNL